MENIFVEFLPPWIETGCQPAFYDKESGTVLQQTARMYDRVNMLVRMFNKLSKQTKETVEEYIDKFNELHDYVMDYFANLDVQEEINNKLDQMVEDGTLQEIIASYLQVRAIFGFDTVADMKSSTNLVDGSFAETYGYYTVGDNGGSKYKIRTITGADVIDESKIIELSGSLVAELVIEDEMNIAQFGAKGDGITDESTIINTALSCNGNDYLYLKFNKSGVYLAQQEVLLYSNTIIDLQDSTIKSCYDGTPESDYVKFGNGLRFMNNYGSMTDTGYGAITNITIKNGTFEGDTSGVGFFLFHALDVDVENVNFHNCCAGTHVFDFGGCKNIQFKNCKFDGFLISDSASKSREMIQFDVATSSATPYWGDGEYGYDNLPTINLTVEKCSFSKGTGTYYPTAIGGHNDHTLAYENIVIRDCIFDDTSFASIRLPKVRNVLIENNIFNNNKNTGASRYCIYNRYFNVNEYFNNHTENILITNNIFNVSQNCTGVYTFGGKQSTENPQMFFNKNIRIIGNTCNGDYDEDTNNVDMELVQAGYVTELFVNNNIINKCRNVFVKVRNSTINHLHFNENKINYCNDFIHVVSNDDDALLQNIIINESNNIWTDSRGTININNFKYRVYIDADVTNSGSLGYVPIMFSSSESQFVKIIDSPSPYSVELPHFIRRYKISGSFLCSGASTTSPNKTIRVYETDPVNGGHVENISRMNIPQNATSDINVLPTATMKNSLKFHNSRIGVQAYLDTDDSIKYEYAGFGKCTFLLIEGY